MANPTTNYGFVLPTSSDLVTDLPADFEVALQGVDTRLKALQPGTTLGDLAYSSATANTNTRLGIGSTGQVLTVAGGVPTWAAPAGGGKVLQVVYATTSTSTNIATTTLTDTGITATITPTASTSKIMVLVAAHFFSDTAGTSVGTKGRLLRDATTIADYPDYGFSFLNGGGTGQSLGATFPVNYLDSPATTSATTYKWQAAVRTTANGTTCDYQYLSTPSSITLLEIGA
jgi:hypothetical protein